MHTSAVESVALPVEVGAERRGGTEMAFILGFVAATIAKMLDPLSLAVAAFGPFRGNACKQRNAMGDHYPRSCRDPCDVGCACRGSRAPGRHHHAIAMAGNRCGRFPASLAD